MKSDDKILYIWLQGCLSLLIPKRRGTGFLKVPAGHHNEHWLSDAEMTLKCDIWGLDGSLDIMCGSHISTYPGKRAEFEKKALPIIEEHFGFSSREASHGEFFDLLKV